MYCCLCSSGSAEPFAELRGARYFRCPRCLLTFLAPGDRPDPERERAHYGTHRNDLSDPGYRAFLARLAEPLLRDLPGGSEGLDYGCGPAPALARLFEEMGHPMQVYDPFFAPDDRALRRSYDFITCTEVAEHFHAPIAEFDGFDRMLRPGGRLGIMTELLSDDTRFSEWRYARDPTHVCFYRRETFRWIAEHYGWEAEHPGSNVVLLRKAPFPDEAAPALAGERSRVSSASGAEPRLLASRRRP